MVEKTIGAVISAMARCTASSRDAPAATWLWMFSTTTMASSMTRPMAAAMPPRVIKSKLSPTSHMASTVTSSVTGMTSVATSVVPQLRRKPHMMSTDSTRPMRMASRTEPTAARTKSDWS